MSCTSENGLGVLEDVARLEATVDELGVGVQNDLDAEGAEGGLDGSRCRHRAVPADQHLRVVPVHVVDLHPVLLAVLNSTGKKILFFKIEDYKVNTYTTNSYENGLIFIDVHKIRNGSTLGSISERVRGKKYGDDITHKNIALEFDVLSHLPREYFIYTQICCFLAA